MTSVESRKLVIFNKVFGVLTTFYSFIIIKKLREINFQESGKSCQTKYYLIYLSYIIIIH